MFLAKIKNKFMYKTVQNDNGSHWYAVYTRKNKVLYCKKITHLFLPDVKRFKQLKSGLLEEKKITSFKTPQGVYKRHIYNDVNGSRLTISNVMKNAVSIKNNIKIRKY